MRNNFIKVNLPLVNVDIFESHLLLNGFEVVALLAKDLSDNFHHFDQLFFINYLIFLFMFQVSLFVLEL